MNYSNYRLRAVMKGHVSRRAFVKGTATAVSLVGLGSSFPTLAAADDQTSPFVRASEFLTGKKLNAILGRRYYAALVRRSASFDTDVSRLLGIIDQVKAADVDALLASTLLDPQSLSTVSKIISSWYLGVVGEGADVELISYAEALMYEPTRGILVVPSYGSGPNSWGDKPLGN